MENSDIELLREYAERGSEAAFGELVARHVNLVYTAALRQVHDGHLAQDVTQTVFIALARQAEKLRHPFLAGWLYRSACFESAKIQRGAARRQAREREVIEMNSTTPAIEPDWDAIAPLLDEAMSQLDEKDRNAILARYFQNQNLKSVGERLGASEEAAQKRVSRALEKLRALLAQRGVTHSATALAASLASHAVTAVPPALAAGVTAAVIAKIAANAGSTFSLFKLMTTTNVKAAALATLLLAAVVGLVFQNQTMARIRMETGALREQVAQLDELRTENERVAKLSVDTDELARVRREHLELVRLRGEIALLRRQLKERQQALSQAIPPEIAQTNSVPVQLVISAKFIEAPAAVLARAGLQAFKVQAGYQATITGILTEEQVSEIARTLLEKSGVDILAAPRVVTQDGRQTQINVTEARTIGGEQYWLGPMLDVIPAVSADHSTVDLTVVATQKQLLGYTETEPAVPIFRNFSANARVTVYDGQTLVLSGPQRQSVGELPKDAKQILVLITPMLVDPAGNRLNLHTPPSVPEQPLSGSENKP
ncbi:MAG TPA: sigma-70 family RNA polymerase sigma factor [Candidatus Eisenbacteria bacterium]|jgi:RNA polymerase sigma factor (sigma-70 family)|nr:sigma-70 family RNA polymerase sigma factor [Candidatus Eisenbacteria bacterium]